MNKQKKINRCHSDNDLQTGSDYLEYHVKMYVETFLWLQEQTIQGNSGDILWNAMHDAHLIHARVLIDFLQKPTPREDDVVAIDYFHDIPGIFMPVSSFFLKEVSDKIGGLLVHITKKPMPALKSQQIWYIEDIATQLLPVLKEFLTIAPDTRLADGVKADCMRHLSKLTPRKINLSVHAST